jgi:hypothetical protein
MFWCSLATDGDADVDADLEENSKDPAGEAEGRSDGDIVAVFGKRSRLSLMLLLLLLWLSDARLVMHKLSEAGDDEIFNPK